METTREELDKRINEFETRLHDAGVKVTHQRRVIFREVAESEEHPDAESVYTNVRKELPHISLDTVYRTLWLLTDLGLINTLGSSHDRTRFDANMKSHHHFICTVCGMTRDFYSDEFDNLDIPDDLENHGKPETLQVEIKGICRSCMGKKGKTS